MIPGRVRLVRPFDRAPEVVLGRAAVRSALFAANPAAAGASVLIGSAAGADEEDVRLRAGGELCERVSNVLAGRAAESNERIVANYARLRRDGVCAVDPVRLTWGGEELRRSEMLWVEGEGMVTGDPVLVPAAAAFLQHRPPPGCAAPVRPGSAGVAAHRSDDAAARHALLEVLERDLLWRAWYGDATVGLLSPAPLGRGLRRALCALGLEPTTLIIDGPGGTACMVACLRAHNGGEESFGARAVWAGGPDQPEHAAERAVHEALMVRWSMGTAAAQLAWERMSERDQPALPRDPLEHALLAFHRPGSLAHLLGRAHRAGDAPPPAPLGVRDLAGAVADHTGEEPVIVDTTMPEVREEGMVVVRVVAPRARRLPADERDRGTPTGGVRCAPPHPLG